MKEKSGRSRSRNSPKNVELGQPYPRMKKKNFRTSKLPFTVSSVLIDEGSCSKVFLGKVKNGEKLAVKVIEKASLLPHQHEEVKNEIEILSYVSHLHPNICTLRTVRENEVEFQLAFDHYNCNLLEVCTKSDGLTEPEAKRLFTQIVNAVAFLHSFKENQVDGICHRDLKLENIVLNEDRSKLALIDFGFSCFIPVGQKLTKQCGSLNYVAPEIINKQSYDGKKIDIWSLGCILYSMVTGRPAFDSDVKEELFGLIREGFYLPLPENFSPELRHLVDSLLRTNASDRLSTNELCSHPWLVQGG